MDEEIIDYLKDTLIRILEDAPEKQIYEYLSREDLKELPLEATLKAIERANEESILYYLTREDLKELPLEATLKAIERAGHSSIRDLLDRGDFLLLPKEVCEAGIKKAVEFGLLNIDAIIRVMKALDRIGKGNTMKDDKGVLSEPVKSLKPTKNINPKEKDKDKGFNKL